MKEIIGSIFSWGPDIAITTNGCIKLNGCAVMGAGIAKKARDKFYGIDKILGDKIKYIGNVPFLLGTFHDHFANKLFNVYSFPTKIHFSENSNIKLIQQSAELIANLYDGQKLYMPRPGCGLGNLLWQEVKPILEKYLDDRFIITHIKKEVSWPDPLTPLGINT